MVIPETVHGRQKSAPESKGWSTGLPDCGHMPFPFVETKAGNHAFAFSRIRRNAYRLGCGPVRVILCDLSRQEPVIVNRESFDLSRPVIRRQRTVADYEFPRQVPTCQFEVWKVPDQRAIHIDGRTCFARADRENDWAGTAENIRDIDARLGGVAVTLEFQHQAISPLPQRERDDFAGRPIERKNSAAGVGQIRFNPDLKTACLVSP